MCILKRNQLLSVNNAAPQLGELAVENLTFYLTINNTTTMVTRSLYIQQLYVRELFVIWENGCVSVCTDYPNHNFCNQNLCTVCL